MTITDGQLHGMIDHWYDEHEQDPDPDGWIADVSDWRDQISDGSTQDMAVSVGWAAYLLLWVVVSLLFAAFLGHLAVAATL